MIKYKYTILYNENIPIRYQLFLSIPSLVLLFPLHLLIVLTSHLSVHRCVGFHVGFEQQPLYHVHKSLHRYRRAPANWLPLTRVMHRNCKRWNCISVSFSQPLPPSLSLRRSLSVSLCRSAVSCCRAPYLCCLLSGPVVVVVATYASSLCVPVFQMHLTRTFPSCQFSFPSFPFPFSFVSFLCICLCVCVLIFLSASNQHTQNTQRKKERCHKAKKAIDLAFLWMVRLIRRCCSVSSVSSMSATTSDSSAEWANSVQSDRKCSQHTRGHVISVTLMSGNEVLGIT